VLGYNFLGNTKAVDAPKAAADQKIASDEPAKKAFTGGDQGFIDLKLKEVEKYNHNTKKLIFELPEDSVSGLNVACKLLTPFPSLLQTNHPSRNHHKIQARRCRKARHPPLHPRVRRI
jgi:hypothetical protein